MTPSEEKCRECPFYTHWCGQYGMAEYPACSHPDSGPRAVNLLDEIDQCPKDI